MGGLVLCLPRGIRCSSGGKSWALGARMRRPRARGLLLPRPYLPLLLPLAGGGDLAVPAAARPLTLFVQGVELDQGALRTGYGMRGDAQ